ncbi:MAG TPA: hypothetical protein PK841_04200, partial [Chitinophagaceae bacterium]|nr:hypothetical protein [Chitinophagaceae bacterium]
YASGKGYSNSEIKLIEVKKVTGRWLFFKTKLDKQFYNSKSLKSLFFKINITNSRYHHTLEINIAFLNFAA